MLKLPPTVVLIVGLMVFLFGAYRIYLAFRPAEQQERSQARGGLYGLRPRTHFLVGLIYILMGGALLASAFGIKIF